MDTSLSVCECVCTFTVCMCTVRVHARLSSVLVPRSSLHCVRPASGECLRECTRGTSFGSSPDTYCVSGAQIRRPTRQQAPLFQHQASGLHRSTRLQTERRSRRAHAQCTYPKCLTWSHSLPRIVSIPVRYTHGTSVTSVTSVTYADRFRGVGGFNLSSRSSS